MSEVRTEMARAVSEASQLRNTELAKMHAEAQATLTRTEDRFAELEQKLTAVQTEAALAQAELRACTRRASQA